MHYLKVITALRTFQKELPVLVGNEMVNYALDNLRAQSFEGRAWQARSPKAKRNTGRRLLIDKGHGERSIRIVRQNENEVVITANDYMQAHNTGFKGTVTVRSFTRGRFISTTVGSGSYSIKTRREGRRSTRTQTSSVSVRSHSRRMNLPKRTFFAPGKPLYARIRTTLTRRAQQLLK